MVKEFDRFRKDHRLKYSDKIQISCHIKLNRSQKTINLYQTLSANNYEVKYFNQIMSYMLLADNLKYIRNNVYVK